MARHPSPDIESAQRDFEPRELVARTSAEDQTGAVWARGPPACPAAESARKDARPREKSELFRKYKPFCTYTYHTSTPVHIRIIRRVVNRKRKLARSVFRFSLTSPSVSIGGGLQANRSKPTDFSVKNRDYRSVSAGFLQINRKFKKSVFGGEKPKKKRPKKTTFGFRFTTLAVAFFHQTKKVVVGATWCLGGNG